MLVVAMEEGEIALWGVAARIIWSLICYQTAAFFHWLSRQTSNFFVGRAILDAAMQRQHCHELAGGGVFQQRYCKPRLRSDNG